MPKGKPKGALPATPGCPLPGTAPGIIEGGVCWLGNGEGPRSKENEEVGRVKSYTPAQASLTTSWRHPPFLALEYVANSWNKTPDIPAGLGT